MILRHNNEFDLYGGYSIVGSFTVNNNTSIDKESIISLIPIKQDNRSYIIPINIRYGINELSIKDNSVFIYGINDNAIYELLAAFVSLIEENGILVPNLRLKEYPKTAHRELMLDIARNKISLSEIKKIVDEMFRNRINYLHLHISDDQNYGIKSRIHPELNNDNQLTLAEIRELIEYCSNRGIEIIPEFDMPGHLNYLLNKIPSLRCNPQKGNSICFSKSHEYLYELIDELCSLFSKSKYFHIGGDELSIKNQTQCPFCREKMYQKKYANPEHLAADFINEMALYVQTKGKTAIVWNDALRYGTIDRNVIVQKWFNYTSDVTCLNEMKKGRKIIISSTADVYFDYPYSITPLRKTYHYIPEINREKIDMPFGVSAHLWTEVISETSDLERKLFPRLQAFGENAWLKTDRLDYKSFLIRLKKELLELEERKIKFANIDEIDRFSVMELLFFLRKKAQFKNYTDFRSIDLMKMLFEFCANRQFPEDVKMLYKH